MGLRTFIAVVLSCLAGVSSGAPCATPDFETTVSGASECLRMRRYGPEQPEVMVVWLHGNITSGGPANAHFALAQETASALASHNLLAVALVRPGYPDGTGARSSGSEQGRADNWQRATVDDIAAAISALRQRFTPRQVILVGHSGGAAIAAVLLGLHPELAQAAVLLSCPCDMAAWRAGRRGPAWASEDPMRWVEHIDVPVLAMTGARDTTTEASLAQRWIRALQARGVHAAFELVPDADHLAVLRGSVPIEGVARVLRELR